MLDSSQVAIIDGAVERRASIDGVYRCAEVFAFSFYVHMVFIEEMVDHADGFLGVATLARAMESYAALRVRTACYQVVEQVYIARRSNNIQDLERAVACGIDAAHRVLIASEFVCATGVRTVVDQPVKGFPIICEMSEDPLGRLLYIVCFDNVYSL